MDVIRSSSGLRGGGADWAKARGPYHLGVPIPKYATHSQINLLIASQRQVPGISSQYVQKIEHQ